MRTCRVCGQPARGQGQVGYCSDECRMTTLVCAWCGVEFRVKRCRVGRRRYCSKSCLAKGRPRTPKAEWVECVCGYCGAEFQRWPSQVVNGRGKFCSRRCARLGRPLHGSPSRIASDAIAEFRSTSDEHGVAEYRIGRWAIDLAFPDRKLAVELDGIYWHSLPAVVDRDARKDAALQARGWTVERIIMDREQPKAIADQIGVVLARVA